MGSRITNRAFTGGVPDIPEGVGDVYRMHDLVRDFHALEDRIGRAVHDAQLLGVSNLILFGLNVTQGTGDTLSITPGRAYVDTSVKVPDSYAANPPTVTTEVNFKRLSYAGETDKAIASAVLDGATSNYVKLRWVDAGTGATRDRLKAAGSWTYEEVDSCEIVVDDTATATGEIELAVFTGSVAGTFSITTSSENSRMSPEIEADQVFAGGQAVGIGPGGVIQAAGAEFLDATGPNLTSDLAANGYGKNGICWISKTRFVVLEDQTGLVTKVRIGEVNLATGAHSWVTDSLQINAGARI